MPQSPLTKLIYRTLLYLKYYLSDSLGLLERDISDSPDARIDVEITRALLQNQIRLQRSTTPAAGVRHTRQTLADNPEQSDMCAVKMCDLTVTSGWLYMVMVLGVTLTSSTSRRSSVAETGLRGSN